MSLTASYGAEKLTIMVCTYGNHSGSLSPLASGNSLRPHTREILFSRCDPKFFASYQ